MNYCFQTYGFHPKSFIETKSTWLYFYASKIYQVALSHDSHSNLREFISITIDILECDNLEIAKNEIWDQVIKWRIAQISNSNLQFTNTHNWTSEEFSSLASAISKCLFLIGFFQMSESDIYNRVWLFRTILLEELEDVIIRCHLIVGGKPMFGQLEDTKISRVRRSGYAITLKNKSYSPCFGNKDL
ncbi:hypothetical protein C2G38_2030473 [Gigaspora rosea]|uniref:Uncharacterized protein n=1 Tax=Gigaspora rosea TaxID=44941 RepID=A0A397VU78_9GLOM|nr:hypothetical protein C2G38_2030473 [Gigaspora rosea]